MVDCAPTLQVPHKTVSASPSVQAYCLKVKEMDDEEYEAAVSHWDTSRLLLSSALPLSLYSPCHLPPLDLSFPLPLPSLPALSFDVPPSSLYPVCLFISLYLILPPLSLPQTYGQPLNRVLAGNYEYRMFLRCRHAAKIRFIKLRSDVLVKLQLLDNKRGERRG